MQSWSHSGFNVFIGEPISPSDTKRLLFAARYLKKCPVSNERLTIREKAGSETRIEYASYKNGQNQTRTFTPLQFLAELQQHIPDRWEQTTRFFGAYSARTRGAGRAKRELSDSVQAIPELEHPPSRNWARLIKKVFELDPLLCPKCGAEMKIKAFITDPREIERITKNLNLPQERAPPKLRYFVPVAA